MAASVLNSPRAIEMSVYVVRAFVRLREAIAGNRELARKIEGLERRVQQKLTIRPSHRRHPQGHSRTHDTTGAATPADRVYSRVALLAQAGR